MAVVMSRLFDKRDKSKTLSQFIVSSKVCLSELAGKWHLANPTLQENCLGRT